MAIGGHLPNGAHQLDQLVWRHAIERGLHARGEALAHEANLLGGAGHRWLAGWLASWFAGACDGKVLALFY
jgi:hypothetical protein